MDVNMSVETAVSHAHPRGVSPKGSLRYAAVSIDSQDESLTSLIDYFNSIDHVDAKLFNCTVPTIVITDHFGEKKNKTTGEWEGTVRDKVDPVYLTILNNTVVVASIGQSKAINVSRAYFDADVPYDNDTYGFLTRNQDSYPSFYLHPLEVVKDPEKFEHPGTSAYGYAVEVSGSQTTLFVPEIGLSGYPDDNYGGFWPNDTVFTLVNMGWLNDISPPLTVEDGKESIADDARKDIRRGTLKSSRWSSEDDVEVRYEEDQLVKRYENHCRKVMNEEFDNRNGRRGRIETDAWRYPSPTSRHAGKKVMIEAKSSTSSSHIRSAIGQLLDYSSHYIHEERECPDRLEILLPCQPEEAQLRLCRSLGIDIAFETSERSGTFERIEVAEDSITALLSLLK